MRLLVGLGNPGARYADKTATISASWVIRGGSHRAARSGTRCRRKFQGEIPETTLDGERVLLLKPQNLT